MKRCRCRFTHDVSAYLTAKPKDILFPAPEDISSSPPYIRTTTSPDAEMSESKTPSVDFSTKCPVFERTGECRHGLKCRFLGGHAKLRENGEIELATDEEKKAWAAVAEKELNFIDAVALKMIRTKKYPHPISDAYLKELQSAGEEAKTNPEIPEQDEATAAAQPEAPAKDTSEAVAQAVTTEGDQSQIDTPDVPLRLSEKKRLHWRGKTCEFCRVRPSALTMDGRLRHARRSCASDDRWQSGMFSSPALCIVLVRAHAVKAVPPTMC